MQPELSVVRSIREIGLEATIAKFKLKSRDYGHKILIKYDQIDSDMRLEEVQDSRGLILEKGTWKVMSLALRKFFNAEEDKAAKIDWLTAYVLEKLDGSMIQVYYDWVVDKWFAGTTGTAEGEGEVNNKEGLNFNDLFWKVMKEQYDIETDEFSKDLIYVFELTTPYNIVVKPHGESSATLLTIREVETLREFPFSELHENAKSFPYPVVKTYDLNKGNIGHIKRTFEGMPWHEEGYIVIDGKHNRVKIKNPAYVAAHHLKSKSAEYNILEIVKTNEIDEFIATFKEREEEIRRLKTKYDTLILTLEGIWEELQKHKPKNITKEEQKKFAIKVFDLAGKDELVKAFSGLFFALKDGKQESVKQYMFEYDNKKLYQLL